MRVLCVTALVAALVCVAVADKIIGTRSGKGSAYSYARTNKHGKVFEIGISIKSSEANTDHQVEKHGKQGPFYLRDHKGEVCQAGPYFYEYSLPFPKIKGLQFTHALLNFNPNGHPPPNVYTTRHFDFHFYTISEKARLSVTIPKCEDRCFVNDIFVPVSCPDFHDRLSAPLHPKEQPAGYVDVGAVEPEMGNHLIFPGAPEFNGKPFTHTWIWGVQDGKISFFEPMVDIKFFESLHLRKRYCFDYPAYPEKMYQAGYYPTKYCLRRRGRFFDVTLNRFRWYHSYQHKG